MAAKTVIGSSGLTYDRVRAILWYDSSSTNTTVTYGLAVGGHGYGAYSTSAALNTSLSCSGQTTYTTSGQGGDFSNGTDVWLNPTSGAHYYTFNRTTSAQTKTIYFSLTSTGSTISGTSSGSLTVTIPALPTYTVKYNANGGIGAPSSQTKTYGKTLTLRTTKPTYTGHTFSKWNTKSDGSGTNYSAGGSYTKNAAVTLYAQWTTNSYTLTYNANGGTCSTKSKSVAYGSTYGTLPTPTRTGYTFKGWYTAASSESQVTSSTKMGAANTTIYAHWTANTVTITYNANGGTQGTSEYTLPFSRTISYNTDINLANIGTFALTKTGYSAKTDAEWNTKSDGTGTSYHQDPAYSWTTFGSTSASTKSVSLYANWQINSYTLTYNANGGTVSPTSKSINYNSTYGTLPTPTRDHYEFNGWFTTASGGTQVTSSTKMGAGNTTIYAHWTLMDFTVTINPTGGTYNGSTSSTNITTIYGKTDNNSIGTASRTGYTFEGWYDINNTLVFDVNGYAVPESGYWSTDENPVWIGMNDIVVYARWEAKADFSDDEYTYKIIDTASVRARARDKTKTEYVPLTSTVTYDEETYTIISLDDCYVNCFHLVTTPTIPNTVTSMSNCFAGCEKLVNAPIIPNSVTDISYCFSGCEKLANINIDGIPNSVVNMSYCFEDCIVLHTAPKLPTSAMILNNCFSGCRYLDGNIFVSSSSIIRSNDIFDGAATLEGHHLYIIPYENNTPHNIWQNIADEYDNVTYLGADDEYEYTAIDLINNKLNVQVLNRTKTTYDSFKTIIQAAEEWTVTSIDNCYKNCSHLDQVMVFMTGFDSYVDAFTNVSDVKIVYVGDIYYNSWSTIVNTFPNVSFATYSNYFEFEYGDYLYQNIGNSTNTLSAAVTSNQTSYNPLQDSFTINDTTYILESLFSCFANTNIETSPTIPASVEIMAECFANCHNLQGNITVLNAPTNIETDCENVFYNTNNDIYIINGYNHTRTSGTDVENAWTTIVEDYTNVHYEANDVDIPGTLTVSRSYYPSSNITCEGYVGQYLSSSFSALKSDIVNLPVGWSVNLHTNDQNYTTVEQMGNTIINNNINIISTNTEFSFTDPNRIFRVNNYNITLTVYYDIEDNNQAVVTIKEKTYNFEPNWLEQQIIPVDSFDSDYIYALGNNNELYAYTYNKGKESYNQWNSNVTHLNYPVYDMNGILLTNRIGCFEKCTELTNNITISSNIIDATNAFNNTSKPIFIINDGTANATTWRTIVENWSNVHFEGTDNAAPNFIQLKVSRGIYDNGNWTEDDGGNYICVEPNISIQTNFIPLGWADNYNYLKGFSISYRESIQNDITIVSESYGKLNTKTFDSSIAYYVKNSNNQYVVANPQPQNQQEFNNNYDNYYVKHYSPTDTKIYFLDNQETQANLTLTVFDFYGHSQSQTAVVYQIFAMLDFIPGGYGMAIGKVGSRNGLDIEFPTTIGDELQPATTYFRSGDTSVEDKTYYEKQSDGEYAEVTPEIGDNPQALGWYEHSNEIDLNNYQLIVGQYNKEKIAPRFIVGNGTSDNNRSNLIEIGDNSFAFNNKYSEEIFYIGFLDDSTYANKLNWVEYNGESPFTFSLPWDCNSVNSLKAYTNTYEYDSNIDYTNNYSILGRTVTINETICTQMIQHNIAFVSITYSAQGKFPYYTFGSDGIGNIGKYSFRIGENSVASGNTSFASGESTIASGINSHAEGYHTEALGSDSHAEGYYTEASGSYSHGEGSHTKASGGISHAEGYYSKALENYSHAEGNHTEASGSSAHAEGSYTTASGSRSHAEGYYSKALGIYSHAQNYFTRAASKFQTALGKYNNDDLQTDVFQGDGITQQFILSKTPELGGYFQVKIEDQDTTDYQLNDTILTFDNAPNNGAYIQVFYSLGTYALIIGNGTADNARSNALTVDWQGNVMAQGMAGQIIMYAGATAPAGWLICDGNEYLIDDYPELYAVIGDTYGTYIAPSDSYHFRVPDFRGRAPVGVGNGTATGHTNHTLGQQEGAETVTLNTSQIPGHTHGPGTLNITASGSHGHKLTYEKDAASGTAKNRVVPGDDTGSSTGSSDATKTATHTHAASSFAGATAQNTGGGGAHNNMQPYIGINYIIATGKTY